MLTTSWTLTRKFFAPGLLAALLMGNAAHAADVPQPMDNDALAATSAGAGAASSTTALQNVTATNTDPSVTANSVTSGAVTFSGNAFSGFNGVGNVVVNTGNNNIIQGTLSVNVAAAP